MADTYKWNTIGHEVVKSLLDRQLASGQTAHAYLFLGPDGVGKRTLAEEFALRLGISPLSVLRFNFATSNLEELRQVLSRAALKPLEGVRQIVILDAAEDMSPASANALLKTLEEPTEATTLVLIANRRTILPTIQSRCQVWNFGSLTKEELRAVALQLNIDADREELLIAAQGRVSRLLELQQPDAFVGYQGWANEYRELLAAPLYQRMVLAARFAQEETADLEARLIYWMQCGVTSQPVDTIFAQRLQVVSEGVRRLKQNGNKKLVMEYIALHVS